MNVVKIGFDTWGAAYDRTPTHKVVPADAIVIERGDLPEVQYASGIGYLTGDDSPWSRKGESDVDLHLRLARARIALAEYLRTHPPVDEAEVERLTTALYRATEDPNDIQPEDVARRLYLAGVRAPEVTE